MESNYFAKLNAIDVSDKEEKKNGLSYLPWAYAWGELKKAHPSANYKVYETESGCIYWNDGKTAWVKTGVTVEEIEHIEYLPVMDFRNKSIPVNAITSFDVNKTIQRSLTKAVARHGVGLYIYAGEDLPEADEEVHKKPFDPTNVKDVVDRVINPHVAEEMEIQNTNSFNRISCAIYNAKSVEELEGLREKGTTNEYRKDWANLLKYKPKDHQELMDVFEEQKKTLMSFI